MEVATSYNRLDDLTARVQAIIQIQTKCRFPQLCLFFCLLHVKDPQRVLVLQQRDSDTWRRIILSPKYIAESRTTRKWSMYCLGRLLHLSEAGIPPTLLDEPWDSELEDVTHAELRRIYSCVFQIELLEPMTFGELHHLSTSLKRSKLFQNTPIPNISDWYERITACIPMFVPIGFDVIPPSLIPRLGIRALLWMTLHISSAPQFLTSLRDREANFIHVLALYGVSPSMTIQALDEWAASGDGQDWYRSLMSTFRTTRLRAICHLTLVILLCVACQSMSFSPTANQPSLSPLSDLGVFVNGHGPKHSREVLERIVSSAIRFSRDQYFQARFSQPQREEHSYLSALLTDALGTEQSMVGCEDHPFDCYWEARMDGDDHTEALAVLMADHPPQGQITHATSYEDMNSIKAAASCSRMTSSTTLNEKRRNMVEAKPLVPDYVFKVHFLGDAGVGKSKIIGRAVNKTYTNEYKPTAYDEYSTLIPVGHKVCKLDIVDGRPGETSRDAVVLVYDTTSRPSFEAISRLFHPTDHSRNTVIMLVGSKIDLKSQRQVQAEEGMVLAKRLGGTFCQVSSSRGGGITQLFRGLALLLLEQQQMPDAEPPGESVWEAELPQKTFWKCLSKIVPCMGGA